MFKGIFFPPSCQHDLFHVFQASSKEDKNMLCTAYALYTKQCYIFIIVYVYIYIYIYSIY